MTWDCAQMAIVRVPILCFSLCDVPTPESSRRNVDAEFPQKLFVNQSRFVGPPARVTTRGM